MNDLSRGIKDIFADTLEKQTPAEREAYLRVACGDDTALRRRVEALLHAYNEADDVPDTPVVSRPLAGQETSLTEGPGTVIDRYRLLERIGEGGMAVVYMAEQQHPIRRKVALKIIKLGMDTQQVIARFEAERQALALMDHPHIAKVLDAGATGTGRPYFVMELVQGTSITEYCDRNSLGTKERLALFVEVCNAVQHAHQKGIIHRDIKPSNVMVTMHDGKPVPKVIDFGIAKATKQRLTEKTLFTRYAQIIGTPVYMSPEQAEMSDVDIDTRSDIYSLGVLLYELLTGTTPFSERQLREAGYAEMQRVIQEEEPTKPSTKLSTLGETLTDVARRRNSSPELLRKTLRGDLDWIVMKALEKDRTQRYDSTSQLAGDVESHLRREPVSAGPRSAWYRTRRLVQRHSRLAVVLLAVFGVGTAGAVVSTIMYLRAEGTRRQMEIAQAETLNVVDFLANDLLASVYPERARGQEVTVRYILESASADLERRFAENPLVEAKLRETLGLTYRKMADYAAAGPHLERALAIRRMHLGEDDPATLTSQDQLGVLCWYQSRYAEAEALLDPALQRRRRVLGHEHPDTLMSMAHLAAVYRDRARYAEGNALLREAYQTGRRVWGEEHPVTLHAMRSLAYAYVTGGEIDQAAALALPGFEISRRVLGEEHNDTLILMNTAVMALTEQERFDEALELAERAVDVTRRVGGEGHLLAIHALSNLACLDFRRGRHQEGIRIMAQAIELSRQHLGEEKACTLWHQFRLALMYRHLDRHEESEALLLETFKASRRRFGGSHPLIGCARYWLDKRIGELEALAGGEDCEAAAKATVRSAELRKAVQTAVVETPLGEPSAN